MIRDSAVPKLSAGVKFRFDQVRDAWLLLAPERLFVPDEHAVEILKLIDGARSFGEMVEALAARFDAPRTVIAGDVDAMLQDLAGKGVVRL